VYGGIISWEDLMTDQEVAVLIGDPEEILADLEKCTKQYVLNVRKTVKFLSSQQKASQFTAKIAIIKEIQEDSNSDFT
jgi:hypothetical protein